MLVDIARKYVDKIVTDKGGDMKALLMDEYTHKFVSMVYTQSQLLEKKVFLPDLIKNKREKMPHMTAIVFIRPDSVANLSEELKAGNFKEYHVFFSNIVTNNQLQELAKIDVKELIKEVQEYYLDYQVASKIAYSLDIEKCYDDKASKPTWPISALERSVNGILAVLLSLKKRPLIRYERNSNMCELLGQRLQEEIKKENSLFSFRNSDSPPIVLLLDRRNDPFTPLLTQWTYQAMLHELVGIQQNIVKFDFKDSTQKEIEDSRLQDFKSCVLPPDDDFFAANMYANFGDLATSVQAKVNELKDNNPNAQKLNSLEDMKKFMIEFSSSRTTAFNIRKHLTIATELRRIVGDQFLLSLSEAEQNMVCNEDHASDSERVKEFLNDPKLSSKNKLRLALLYALRHEKVANNITSTLVDKLAQLGIQDDLKVISNGIAYGGAGFRLYQKTAPATLSESFRRILNNVKGVENVFTQHKPAMYETIDAMMTGKLNDAHFPFVGDASKQKPQDIVIFFVGGVTYEEAKFASDLTEKYPGLRLVVGGTNIVNSQMFMDQLKSLGSGQSMR